MGVQRPKCNPPSLKLWRTSRFFLVSRCLFILEELFYFFPVQLSPILGLFCPPSAAGPPRNGKAKNGGRKIKTGLSIAVLYLKKEGK
jgi:hypothetical protein